MHIPSNKILKSNAVHRIHESLNAGKIVLIHTGIITAVAALVTVVNHCLGLQISQMGGLSNMTAKSLLSTVQSVLPMVQSALIMCLNLGYLAAVMRVSREQYVTPQTLKLGFDRFWLLLKTTVMQSCIYFGIVLLSAWIAAQVFMMTPFFDPLMELLTPYMSETTAMDVNSMPFLQDEALYLQLVQTMIPMLVLFAVVYLVIYVPVSYSFRMVNYILVDKPGISAAAALRESRAMMRGKRMRLFKLDLSFWWWHLLGVGLSALCYGDVLLPMVGVTLPMNETVSFFLFYFLFLAGQFAMYVFLRNRVEVTYAQVYDKIRPREECGGAVLGNIFQMQED